MRRPIDPRNHGLREPEKVHTRVEVIRLGIRDDLAWKNSPVSLQTVFSAWNKALMGHISQGHKIVKDPIIDTDLTIVYTIGWDNETYEAERLEYDHQVGLYETELAKHLQTEKELKELPPSHAKVIEIKIEQARKRLANLEAVRDNKPLPFP